MSEPMRIALVGATGLIGRSVIAQSIGRQDIRLAGIARREMPLPKGARMEMFVADPENWGDVFEALKPAALICALGTTWRKAGKDEAAFRAVDHDLVLQTAEAAHRHGIPKMVVVSSVGADPQAKNFYLRVKGETEQKLHKVGLERLDVLRPGLLKGPRENDRRALERLGIVLSPLVDLMLHGKYRAMRSIDANDVAQGALALCMRKAAGKFAHDNDGIRRAANSLPQLLD